MYDVIGGEFSINLNDIPHVPLENDKTLYSSGRCALYLILKDIEIDWPNNFEILLPNYLCDSIPNTVTEAGWSYKFYSINMNLYANTEELLSYCKNDNTVVLLINYFGIINLESIVLDIKKAYPNTIVIIDNVQAFFEPEIKLVDYVFTSYRKWFPCPDGASIIKRNNEKMFIPALKNSKFAEYKFAGNLLKNFTAYLNDDICLELISEGENILNKDYLCWGSKISATIFPNLNLQEIARIRKNNALILHENLTEMGIPHMYRESTPPLYLYQSSFIIEMLLEKFFLKTKFLHQSIGHI